MQLGPLGDGLLHALVHQLHRGGRDQRPDDGAVILRIAGGQRLGARDELLQELIGDLALHDDAARVEADLALVEERAERGRAHRIVHVDVVENDHRVVAAQLHRGALQRLAGALGEHLGGLHAADQIDDAHLGASKNTSAISPAAPGAWVTTLMTPGGKPASSAICARIRPAEIGANSEGFTTTVLPAATGEMTARQDSTLAPFHGVKLATTPRGRRTPIECEPGTLLQDFALGEVHPARRLLDGGGDQILLEGGEGDRAAGFLRENLERSRRGGASRSRRP
jgi:hypothetical protein